MTRAGVATSAVLSALANAAVCVPAAAAPATQFQIYATCPGNCPGAAIFISVRAGDAFSISVSALDAIGQGDPTFTGTIQFSSSDPAATLPVPYTFTASDFGSHFFLAAGILRTPGTQTITVTDSQGRLAPGGLTLEVQLQPSAAIPVISPSVGLLFVLLLALTSLWMLRR